MFYFLRVANTKLGKTCRFYPRSGRQKVGQKAENTAWLLCNTDLGSKQGATNTLPKFNMEPKNDPSLR